MAIDSVSFGPQTTDISTGRLPDATGAWRPMTDPTPEFKGAATRIADDRPYLDAAEELGCDLAAIMAVAEARELMPPKSSYVAPKPRSGIFLRILGTGATSDLTPS